MNAGNTFNRGKEMAKSAWRVLKLDKELTAIPFISFMVSLVALVPFAVYYLSRSTFTHNGPLAEQGSSASWQSHISQPEGIIMSVLIYFLLTLISNFFMGAVIFGATERFNKGDPTIKSSLRGAWRKIGPLAFFSLMMASVGLVLQVLEDRVPFAGKLAVWLLDAAWSVANVFAVPIIVLSDKKVMPLDATKQSVGMIKKIWGESVVANLGVNLIAFLCFLGYMLLMLAVITVVGAISSATHAPAVILIPFALLGVLGLVALILIFSTLSGIAKAALYHYATTGEAPEAFNRDLLQAAMTPKKARKIFD